MGYHRAVKERPRPRQDIEGMKETWGTLTTWKEAIEATRKYWNHVNCGEECVEHYHCSPFGSSSCEWDLDHGTLGSINEMLENELLPCEIQHYCHRGPEGMVHADESIEYWWQEDI